MVHELELQTPHARHGSWGRVHLGLEQEAVGELAHQLAQLRLDLLEDHQPVRPEPVLDQGSETLPAQQLDVLLRPQLLPEHEQELAEPRPGLVQEQRQHLEQPVGTAPGASLASLLREQQTQFEQLAPRVRQPQPELPQPWPHPLKRPLSTDKLPQRPPFLRQMAQKHPQKLRPR